MSFPNLGERLDLSQKSLVDSNFNSLDLTRASFRDSLLMRASIMHSTLLDVDFTGSDLSNAFLSSSCLAGSRLVGANLRGADLSCSDLKSADLSLSCLVGADLTRCRFDASVRADGCRIDVESIETSDCPLSWWLERGVVVVDSPKTVDTTS